MSRRNNTFAAAIVFLAGLAAAAAAQGPAAYDLLIRNVRILDGTGAPWFRGDLAVRGDTIAAAGHVPAAEAGTVIDGKGLVLAPGFIDIHTHARRGILQVPTADNYTRQGVTTLVEGQDGSSPVPLAPFLDRVAAARPSANFGMLIGQGSVRESVLGNVDRIADPAELARMVQLVSDGMRDGAFGLSTGLFYTPGSFSPTEEIIPLARAAGVMGGIHVSHMRDEASHIIDSVRETIRIGEMGGLPTQITHHKIIGTENWGKSVETLRLVEEARARGVDVTIDQYPYTASSTSIAAALMPKWALEGSRQDVVKRLTDPEQRGRIKQAVINMLKHERGGGDPTRVAISSCRWDPSLDGKNLSEVTRGFGMEPTIENAAEAAMRIEERGGAQGIFHAISEEDLQRILRFPLTMIASDGEVTVFGKESPHPRSYGTFVRVLGVYVREKQVLQLEEAVRRMTSLPAMRLGLADRGIIRPGMKADLVLFDPQRVRDRATFENPHQYPEGIMTVVVNGQVIFDGKGMTAARPGRVLHGPAYQTSH
jgi:dihydroorotase/N-acyl-D-amino-acid deacylase